MVTPGTRARSNTAPRRGPPARASAASISRSASTSPPGGRRWCLPAASSPGLFVAAVVLMLAGVGPADLYDEFVVSIFSSTMSISAVLIQAAPLLIVGLSAVVAFRVRFWNIGIEGQMIFGSIFATFVAIHDLGPESSAARADAGRRRARRHALDPRPGSPEAQARRQRDHLDAPPQLRRAQFPPSPPLRGVEGPEERLPELRAVRPLRAAAADRLGERHLRPADRARPGGPLLVAPQSQPLRLLHPLRRRQSAHGARRSASRSRR